jgi:hypothetical protein
MKTFTLVAAIAIAASALTAAQTIDVSRYRMVDLSHAYGPNTLYWPTSASKFALSRDASGQTPGTSRRAAARPSRSRSNSSWLLRL